MKKPSVSWLYLALFGVSFVGIGIALEVCRNNNLYAFSHSLDMHANEHEIEEAYKRRQQAEMEDRKRIEEDRKRQEEQKRIEEIRRKNEELKIRRQEEERRERAEWQEENRRKYS